VPLALGRATPRWIARWPSDPDEAISDNKTMCIAVRAFSTGNIALFQPI
jgi:hypothetical protein